MDTEQIYTQIQNHYGSRARTKDPIYSNAVAQAFGYSAEKLTSISSDANLGLSCGNPLAIASLQAGEIVVDLGSGAGFDVFLAAPKVGLKGRVIGIDMNKDMLERARRNSAESEEFNNVSFIEGKITSIPIADSVVDCIISNCVINLVPSDEKFTIFSEMARILKPRGRIAISDILARKPLPYELKNNVAAYVGCVAGCSLKSEYERYLVENGFRDTKNDLNIYMELTNEEKNEDGINASSGCLELSEKGSSSAVKQQSSCCSGKRRVATASNKFSNLELTDIDLNEWVGSYRLYAVKM